MIYCHYVFFLSFFFLNNNTYQRNPQTHDYSNMNMNVKMDFSPIKLIKASAVSTALKCTFPTGSIWDRLRLRACKQANAEWHVILYETWEGVRLLALLRLITADDRGWITRSVH